ncbi:DUF2231 domain-containing protein [Pacificimonas flava]|uniref:DUF2231 domain-containing protein n=1 Tax=Pacificimonas flava TaxID=1234595 RepID=UPI000570672B|nr:DUF2231 domain-containing protein [Pacificimonas flava]MBB5279135.1 putative membrane protein [Pacificimonas flava]
MPARTLSLSPTRPPHPLHALLLAGSFPLFLGCALADWTYAASYQVQWTNFAAWLNAGALLFCGLALLLAAIDVIRGAGRGIIYGLLLLATFAIGLVNAFVHAKDAWGAMPAALILSVITALLSAAATWAGLRTLRPYAAKAKGRA